MKTVHLKQNSPRAINVPEVEETPCYCLLASVIVVSVLLASRLNYRLLFSNLSAVKRKQTLERDGESHKEDVLLFICQIDAVSI